MGLQYVNDENGDTTAVQIPIEDWKKMNEKHGDLQELPQWQKDMIDERIQFMKDHPDKMIPMEEFEKLLEDEDEDL